MNSAQMNKCKYKKLLCTCFKTEDEEDDLKPQRRRNRNATADPVLAYLAAADKDGIVLISTTVAEECGDNRRKGGRDVWYSLKMALNETSLMKMIHCRRKTKKEPMSRTNTSVIYSAPRTPQQLNPNIINKHKPTRRTTSNSSANISISSSQSSITSSNANYVTNTPSHEINIVPEPPLLNGVSEKNMVEYTRKRNTALCILWVFSLLVLVLWGRLFAILCTSIWFYIVPSRQRKQCKEEVLVYKESDFNSAHYKKKIIMEGILERSHSRASLLTCANS